MELDSRRLSPWPGSTTSSPCRRGRGGCRCLTLQLSQWGVTEGEGSTASVPLTAIQKGKRCSIPPDLKRPSAGAPARTAAAAALPSQRGGALPRWYGCSYPHARSAFLCSQLLSGRVGSCSLCPRHLVLCGASGDHPMQPQWQTPLTCSSLNEPKRHRSSGSWLRVLLASPTAFLARWIIWYLVQWLVSSCWMLRCGPKPGHLALKSRITGS